MAGAITEITVALAIDSERFLQYYRGKARQVVARSLDGRTVRFPAEILQRFLTHEGVHGVFVIRYDANNRFLGIERRGTV
ncbi:MAG TPA: DUF2835 family protein [Gammaproteobacteria bacterium]|nr:DUF2835 family protein [Gammaproteobacteria bacterium]